MKHFSILFKYEWLNFKANKGLQLLLVLTLILGLYSIYYGHSEIERQKKHLQQLNHLTEQNIDELNDKYPEGTDAGNIGYYHSTFASNPPSSWAALAMGQRDINPIYIKLRLLNLQSQLYESDIINPMKTLAGNFDLSFVFIYFIPLLIISLGFNVLSLEKEQGTLAMLLSQPIKTIEIVIAKLIFRICLVLSIVYFLSLIGVWYTGIPIDNALFLWLLLVSLNCLFWFAVVFLIVSLQKTSSFNSLCLLGIWICLTFIIPAGLNVYVDLKEPLPQALELTIKQREEVHGGWDLPKKKTMQEFFSYYPEWKNTPKIEGRFDWRWYYAFQHLGDVAVAPLFNEYFEGLRKKQELVSKMNFLSVPVNVQSSMNAIAATDLNTHLSFLESAKKYHDSLRAFYYPYLYDQVLFKSKDFELEPRHSFQSQPTYNSIYVNLFKIGISILLILILSLWIFKSKSISIK